MRTDVLIAGAGPAGSIAALILARAGFRVRLLDRARFPRAKLCGDTINPGALQILRRIGVADLVEDLAAPVRGMLVSGPGGVQVRGEYPEGVHGLSIGRSALDALLLQRALEAGAAFEPGVTVRGPVVDRRGRVAGVAIATPRGGRQTLSAPFTIAADGRRSALAFALGLASQPRWHRRWAIGAYFDRGAADPRFGEMHIRSGYYFGVAALPDGRTNACLVIEDPPGGSLARPRGLLERTLRDDHLAGARFRDARLLDGPVMLGPLAVETRRAGVDGLVLAGDAAGFVDPMTGDGLRFAFRGAELAAAAASGALTGARGDAAATLLDARRRAFGGKWRLNRALRLLVASPSGVSVTAAAARCFPSGVRRLIAAAGDIAVE